MVRLSGERIVTSFVVGISYFVFKKGGSRWSLQFAGSDSYWPGGKTSTDLKVCRLR